MNARLQLNYIPTNYSNVIKHKSKKGEQKKSIYKMFYILIKFLQNPIRLKASYSISYLME